MVHTISKDQLMAFYSSHWDQMKPYIVGHYLTGINAHGIYVRNLNGAPIAMTTKEAFLTWVYQKYITQIIPELPLIDHQDETNELLIDMDSPFPVEKNLQYMQYCWTLANVNLQQLTPHIIAVFTGGKSFHLRIKINRFVKWTEAKQLLINAVIKPFYAQVGDTITFPPSMLMPPRADKLHKLHLDMSSMKNRGALRCPYSFYDDTNRFALPLTSFKALTNFHIAQATFTDATAPPIEVKQVRPVKKTTVKKASSKPSDVLPTDRDPMQTLTETEYLTLHIAVLYSSFARAIKELTTRYHIVSAKLRFLSLQAKGLIAIDGDRITLTEKGQCLEDAELHFMKQAISKQQNAQQTTKHTQTPAQKEMHYTGSDLKQRFHVEATSLTTIQQRLVQMGVAPIAIIECVETRERWHYTNGKWLVIT